MPFHTFLPRGMRYSQLPADQESPNRHVACPALALALRPFAGQAHHVASATDARNPGVPGPQPLDFAVAGGTDFRREEETSALAASGFEKGEREGGR